MSTNEQLRGCQASPTEERSIRMWERLERAGVVCWVMLDRELKPISDIALQDIQGPPAERIDASSSLLLVRGAGVPTKASGFDQDSMDRLVVQAIRRILEEGDATTYQICLALIHRLDASAIGEDFSIDVAGLLDRDFRYYETPAVDGHMTRRWTVAQRGVKTPPCATCWPFLPGTQREHLS